MIQECALNALCLASAVREHLDEPFELCLWQAIEMFNGTDKTAFLNCLKSSARSRMVFVSPEQLNPPIIEQFIEAVCMLDC
jgi:hypothetical protein